MTEEQRDSLIEVFLDVVQNMAFMFGDASDCDEEPAFDDSYVLARMTFSGPMSGELALAAPRAMCVELAANLLGLEPDDETAADKADDSLKELLNVTCGNALTAIAGETPVFDLGMPEVENLDEQSVRDVASSGDSLCLNVEQYTVVLRFSVK